MKNKLKIYLSIAFMALTSLSATVMAQPHPGDPGAGGDAGGPALGAPISSGANILITLALVYGVKLWYIQNKQGKVKE